MQQQHASCHRILLLFDVVIALLLSIHTKYETKKLLAVSSLPVMTLLKKLTIPYCIYNIFSFFLTTEIFVFCCVFLLSRESD